MTRMLLRGTLCALTVAATLLASAADWPLTRGGLARWGAAAGEPGPGRPKLVWRWKSGDEGFLSTPAVVGNRVYVASATMGALAESGQIYCFDAATGRRVWAVAPPGYRPTFSSPVISGKYLVCGEGLHLTADSRVVCYDISDEAAPKLLWSYSTNSHVECSPVIYKDKVYIGAGDDGYYCFALEPADNKGKAKVVWHAGRERYKDAETGLTVHDGKVYAGLGIGGNALCVLDAETGVEQTRVKVPYPIFAPPTIADGKLYLGMGNGDFINVGRGGEVRCLDLATLNTLWTRELPQTVLGAMPVRDGKVYAGCRDGVLYCFNAADGTPVGQFAAGAPIVTAPAVSEQFVYVFADDGMLYALDRATLAPKWEFLVGLEPLFISSPTVGTGRVYIGSQNDGFLCIGEAGAPLPPLWVGKAGGPGKGGNPADGPLPDAGAFQWQYPDDQMGENARAYVQAPVAGYGRTILVPLAEGPKLGLACLPVALNQQETPKPLWVYGTKLPVKDSPVVVGDTVFCVESNAQGTECTLHAVNVADGKPRWSQRIRTAYSNAIAATPRGVLALLDSRTTELVLRDVTDGKALWGVRDNTMRDFAVAGDRLLVLNGRALTAHDTATGEVVWTVESGADMRRLAVADDVVLLVSETGAVAARKLADGRPIDGWAWTGDAPVGDVAASDGRLIYTTAKGELVIADAATGKVVRTIGGVLADVQPLVSRGMVLYAVKDNLMAVSLAKADAKPAPWMDTSWLGTMKAPMVLHHGSVYVGMAGWGVARLGKAR